jgi:hypothetical protein
MIFENNYKFKIKNGVRRFFYKSRTEKGKKVFKLQFAIGEFDMAVLIYGCYIYKL